MRMKERVKKVKKSLEERRKEEEFYKKLRELIKLREEEKIVKAKIEALREEILPELRERKELKVDNYLVSVEERKRETIDKNKLAKYVKPEIIEKVTKITTYEVIQIKSL